MKQRGFTLLEMLIVMFIMETLFVIAFPNPVQLVKMGQRKGAQEQVEHVRNAANAQVVCAAQNLTCPGVSQQIPSPGTIRTQAYMYTYTVNADGTWNYLAIPNTPPNRSFYADQTGLVRYADSGAAGPTSQLLL